MGKPGVMLYFDIIPALEHLTDGARGKLLLAFLRYARDGQEPDPPLRGMSAVAWSFLQNAADRDDEAYQKKVENARRSTEKREARKRRLDDILTDLADKDPSILDTLEDTEEPSPTLASKASPTTATTATQLQSQLQSQSQQQPQQQQQSQPQQQHQFQFPFIPPSMRRK